ncbi:MAG: alpha/beta fold hydrolase, partial [Cupriavidus necator]
MTQAVSSPSPVSSSPAAAPLPARAGNAPLRTGKSGAVERALQGWQRLRWQAGSMVRPSATARALEHIWFNPPRAAATSAARHLLDSARADWALVTGQGPSRRVRVYRWGTSGPVVLLAHGWGGHAGQWHAVVEGLLAAGMRVVAFDALSHGASDAGARGAAQTSVLEMSRSLLAAAWH